jgi:flagellar biogenesis protein FliO
MFSDFTGATRLLVRWLSLPRRWPRKQVLQVLESVPLTTQASVALVRFEKEILVLGVTAQNVTVLVKRQETRDRGEDLVDVSAN